MDKDDLRETTLTDLKYYMELSKLEEELNSLREEFVTADPTNADSIEQEIKILEQRIAVLEKDRREALLK